MVIEKVCIQGYGRLKNLEIKLDEGLNLIYGLNETGKSTLKRCILALLFGQKVMDEDGNSPPEKESMKPWDNAAYGASLTYSLKNGQRFTISRDFDKDEIKIVDAFTEKDLTEDFPKNEQGEPDFIREHLHITHGNFISSALIQHDQMLHIEDSDALSSTITALADSASDEHTYLSALLKLRAASSRLGEEDNPQSPLGKVAGIVQASEMMQQESREKLKQIEEMAKSLSEKQEVLRNLNRETSRINYFLKKPELDKLDLRIEEIEKFEEEIKEQKNKLELASIAESINLDSRTELFSLDSRQKAVNEKLEEANKRRDELMTRYSDVREKLEDKSRLLKVSDEVKKDMNLGGAAEARLAVIESKKLMLEEAKAKEKTAKEKYDKEHEIFGEFKNAEDYDGQISKLEIRLNQDDMLKTKKTDLDRLTEEMKNLSGSITKRFYLAVAAIIIGGMAGFLSLQEVMLKGFKLTFPPSTGVTLVGVSLILIIVGILYALDSKRYKRELKIAEKNVDVKKEEISEIEIDMETADDKLKELFEKVGAESVKGLRKRYRDYNRRRIDFDTAVDLVKTLENELTELSKEYQDTPALKDYLKEIGYLEGDSLSDAVKKFKTDYEEALKLDTEAKELRKSNEEFMEERKKIEEESEELSKSIGEILSLGKVKTIQEFDEAFHLAQETDKIKERLASLEDKRKLLAEGMNLFEMKEKREHILQSIKNLSFDEKTSLDDLKEMSDKEIEKKLEDYSERIIHVKSDITAIELKIDNIRMAANALVNENELEEARKKLAEYRRHKKAIDIAADMVANTGKEYREKYFAPQLARETADYLKTVTSRYDEIIIDEKLKVKVKSKEKDEFVNPEFLSKGVMDQLYFVLRVGMARILSKGHESIPFVMDDPFLKFDRNRRKKAFALLFDMSKEHQILLFSCSSSQKQSFAKMLNDYNKVARLFRVGELEFIKPIKPLKPKADEKKKEDKPFVRPSTTFLRPPPGIS